MPLRIFLFLTYVLNLVLTSFTLSFFPDGIREQSRVQTPHPDIPTLNSYNVGVDETDLMISSSESHHPNVFFTSTANEMPQMQQTLPYRVFQYAINTDIKPVVRVMDMAVAPDGTLYILDWHNHRVLRYGADGQFLGMWGGLGSAPGRFYLPTAIAVAPDGTVYVTESLLGDLLPGRGRIQRFSATGDSLYAWGEFGDDDGQIFGPSGIAVADDIVYVVDDLYSRIQLFNAYNGKFLGVRDLGGVNAIDIEVYGNTVFVATRDYILSSGVTGEFRVWSSGGSRGFSSISDIAVASDGTVYVADSRQIQYFSAAGEFLGVWETYKAIDAIAVDPRGGTVYVSVSDHTLNSIILLLDTTGNVSKYWEVKDIVKDIWRLKDIGDQFEMASDVAIAHDGTVYIVDEMGKRILRFSADGVFLGAWRAKGHSIAVAPDGRTIYVADLFHIQRFSADGVFLDAWGSEGSGEGQFDHISDIEVAPDNTVYVVDTNNHRIQRFSSTGKFIGMWGEWGGDPGQFYAPSGIAVARDGTVYVVERMNSRVQYFSREGVFLGEWGAWGESERNFRKPEDVAVAPDGTVYVADTVNDRIQLFSPTGGFLGMWDDQGSGNGQFSGPAKIAVAPDDTVYVVDQISRRIQLFDAKGTLLDVWGLEEGDPHQTDAAIARDGTVYVADSWRILRFSADGIFLGAWRAKGYEIAVAPDGRTVYVADSNRIQRFNANGVFLNAWGLEGSGEGHIADIAVAPDGVVYVAIGRQIQRFSPTGEFRGMWDLGNIYVHDIAVAHNGTVYIGKDYGIQLLNSAGEFLDEWEVDSQEIYSVEVAPDKTVYVLHGFMGGGNTVDHFSSTGDFLGSWGGIGIDYGKFMFGTDMAVAPDGTVYIVDWERIQVFGEQYPDVWRGEFFSNDWLTGPVRHVQTVPNLFLNLSWSDRPAAKVPADHFSSRWIRYVHVPTTRSYRLIVRADDGIRFWIDNLLVFDSWQPGVLTREFNIQLSAGYHLFQIEHRDYEGAAMLVLEWMTAPEAPSNLRQTSRTTTSITLAWQDNSNNETEFHLDRWDDNDSGWKRIATLGANVTSYTDTSVNCGQSNRYRVSAYNAAGWSAASEVTTTTERCPLILIPGIMGSYIYLKQSELWPGVLNPARFAALRDLGPESVVVRDAIRTYTLKLPKLPFSPDIEVNKVDVYSRIIDFLKSDLRYVEYPDINNEHVPETTPLQRCQQAERDGQKPTLFVFAYDWRQSNIDSAKQLKKYIDCVRRIHRGSRVDIIAHSMGGLVARRYLIDNGYKHHVARLITIATPFYGAARAVTAIAVGRFPDVASWLPGKPMFEYEMMAVADTAVGAHELLPSRAYFEAYFEQQQCPLVFLDEYNELWETKYSYRCVSHDEFTGWINLEAARSGDNAARFHAGFQDDWRNDKDLLEFVPTYYHIVSTDRQTLSGVVLKKICTQLSPLGTLLPFYMCGSVVVDGSRDYGDGTVPARSGEHARYRNPQAQLIKVPGEHTEMLSEGELHYHLRRILLGSETEASQPGETASSGHISVAGVLSPQATTVASPSIASSTQTTFFKTALHSPSEHTRQETMVHSSPTISAASNNTPVAEVHYLQAINVVSLTITDRTGQFPSAVTFDHLDDGVYTALLPPDDVYTATITLKAREGAIIEIRTGTNDTTKRAVRYLDIFPAQRNRQVQVVFFQNGFSLLRQDTDADGLFETEIPPTAEISGDAANDHEPPVIDVSASGPLDARTVTITATDVSGVANIRYSFDGITFRAYTGSFVVDATQTPVIYIFADDRAANRSELFAYPLSWQVYLPLTIR